MSQISPWKRGGIEATLIAGSILFAFWIDASWDGRQAGQLESAVVMAVVAEIEANRSGLEEALVGTEGSLALTERLVRLTRADVSMLPPDSVGSIIDRFSASPEHEPLLGAASNLLQTAAIDRSGIAARGAVSRWLQALADYEVERAVLQRRQESVHHELARHAMPYASEGIDILTFMISRSRSPDAIADLRADETLMVAAVEMGFSQVIYAARIRRLLALADTVTGELLASR